MSLTWRILLISLTISVGALTSLSLVMSSWMNGILRETSLRRVADNVNRETRVLQQSLDILKADVLVLADLESVVPVAGAAPDRGDAPDSDTARAARDRLTRAFMTLMLRRPSYTQIRLISAFEDGRELVRVNRSGEEGIAVPNAELQRKGDRYYLDETLKVAPGTIYVSRVDLNREHDRIVEPHEPVFRVGTPITLRDGTVLGAIVINILFDRFVGEMRPPTPDIDLYVTNEDGDFLRHPDPHRQFAFEFGRRERIQDLLPLAETWPSIVANAPVARILAGPKLGVVFDRISLANGDGSPGRQSLIVAAVASISDLDAQARSFRGRVLLGGFAISVMLAIALGLTTMGLVRPITRLTEAAGRIAEGKQNILLVYNRADEIGILSRTLAKMLRALRDAARAEEMASMGRMASMVAHDLRNALSSVKMNVQILGRRHTSSTDLDTAHLRISLEQIQYMENILSDMLSFARGDTLKIMPVDLNEVMSAAVLSELPSIEGKGIDLALELPTTGLTVDGDKVKLAQVFQNLIENAVQASPQGGRIGITGRIVDDGQIVVEIVDNGEGIPQDVRAKVFEPFFTTRTKGTGLGLAIVNRIVKEHRGGIDLSQRASGGTIATVTLPARATAG